jgi:hypothetical protein
MYLLSKLMALAGWLLQGCEWLLLLENPMGHSDVEAMQGQVVLIAPSLCKSQGSNTSDGNGLWSRAMLVSSPELRKCTVRAIAVSACLSVKDSS